MFVSRCHLICFDFLDSTWSSRNDAWGSGEIRSSSYNIMTRNHEDIEMLTLVIDRVLQNPRNHSSKLWKIYWRRTELILVKLGLILECLLHLRWVMLIYRSSSLNNFSWCSIIVFRDMLKTFNHQNFGKQQLMLQNLMS